MKKHPKDLIFISRILRDGSGTVEVRKELIDIMRNERREYFLHCLSLTEKTFIINGFNSFVVKVRE